MTVTYKAAIIDTFSVDVFKNTHGPGNDIMWVLFWALTGMFKLATILTPWSAYYPFQRLEELDRIFSIVARIRLGIVTFMCRQSKLAGACKQHQE